MDIANIITLASLIHDLGKIYQRGIAPEIKHEECLERLLEESKEFKEALRRAYGELYRDILNLAEAHHERLPKPSHEEVRRLVPYLIKADRESARERTPIIYREAEKISRIHNFHHMDAPFINPLWTYVVNTVLREYENICIKDLNKEVFRRAIESIKAYLRDIEKGEEALETIEKNENVAKFISWLSSKDGFAILPFSIRFHGIVSNIPQILNSWKEKFGIESTSELVRHAYLSLIESVKTNLNNIGKAYGLLIEGHKGLINTLYYLLMKDTLFVPSAVFGAIMPDLSLYAHLTTTAAIARASLKTKDERYGLLRVDLSGIQSFITKFTRTAKATTFMRGRSLLVELIQRAVARYLVEQLDLADSNIIVITGGQVELIVPSGIHEVVNRIRSILDNFALEELNGELYVSLAYEEIPYKLGTVKGFKDLYLLLDPDYEIKGKDADISFVSIMYKLSKELNRRKFKRYSASEKGLIAETMKGPHICPSCKMSFEEEKLLDKSKLYKRVASGNISIFRKFLRELEETYIGETEFFDIEKICPLCMTTYLVGIHSRNLKFIVELFFDNVTDEFMDKLYDYSFNYLSAYDTVTTREVKYGSCLIVFRKLRTAYMLIDEHVREPRRLGVRYNDYLVLRHLLCEVFKEVRRLSHKMGISPVVKVMIYAVNDLSPLEEDKIRDPITNEEVSIVDEIKELCQQSLVLLDYIGIGFIMINTWVPTVIEKGRPRVKTFDELGNEFMIVMGKMDGDSAGKIMALISASPTRYVTVSLLYQFFFNIVVNLLLWMETVTSDDKYANHVYIIYSGGDDMTFVAHWLKGIEFALMVNKWWHNIFPFSRKIVYTRKGTSKEYERRVLSVSAGLNVVDTPLPIHITYFDAISMLERAKEEGRDRVCLLSIDPVMAIFTELKLSSLEYRIHQSISWRDLEAYLKQVRRLLDIMREGSISHSLAYRLYELSLRVTQAIRDRNIPELCNNLAWYVYLMSRDERAERELMDILQLTPAHEMNLEEFALQVSRIKIPLAISLLKLREEKM